VSPIDGRSCMVRLVFAGRRKRKQGRYELLSWEKGVFSIFTGGGLGKKRSSFFLGRALSPFSGREKLSSILEEKSAAEIFAVVSGKGRGGGGFFFLIIKALLRRKGKKGRQSLLKRKKKLENFYYLRREDHNRKGPQI